MSSESLKQCQLQRLMQLAIEAAELATVFSEHLVDSYRALAAQCATELWWRRSLAVPTVETAQSLFERQYRKTLH